MGDRPSATTNRSATAVGQRLLDVVLAVAAIVLLLPLIAATALTIKCESRGPVLIRCRRVGRSGREFWMLKFRKMHSGAAGPPLTAVDDERFTRIGKLLASTKVDEVPQLWNVLTGRMSVVGPRPEDPSFVALWPSEYEQILRVRPGITGLSQLAFAREVEILDPHDRIGDYTRRLLPQKMSLDQLYVTRRSSSMNLRILWWTIMAIVLRRQVAVNRDTGRLNARRRPAVLDGVQVEGVPS